MVIRLSNYPDGGYGDDPWDERECPACEGDDDTCKWCEGSYCVSASTFREWEDEFYRASF